MQPHEKMDLKNSCYKTKDDKRHNTVVSKPYENMSQKRWEEIFEITEEERIKRMKEFINKKQKEPMSEVDAPHPSMWNPEWTVLSTGKRMSKRELKDYCQKHGKTWENS